MIHWNKIPSGIGLFFGVLDLSAQLAEQQIELNSLRKQKASCDGILAREQERMQQLYPHLKKLHAGYNSMDMEWLDGFHLDGKSLRVIVSNTSASNTSGRFSLCFLNREGFVTSEYKDSWAWQEVKPGERRVSESTLVLRAGFPVYCLPQIETR